MEHHSVFCLIVRGARFMAFTREPLTGQRTYPPILPSARSPDDSRDTAHPYPSRLFLSSLFSRPSGLSHLGRSVDTAFLCARPCRHHHQYPCPRRLQPRFVFAPTSPAPDPNHQPFSSLFHLAPAYLVGERRGPSVPFLFAWQNLFHLHFPSLASSTHRPCPCPHLALFAHSRFPSLPCTHAFCTTPIALRLCAILYQTR